MLIFEYQVNNTIYHAAVKFINLTDYYIFHQYFVLTSSRVLNTKIFITEIHQNRKQVFKNNFF